MKHHFEHRSNGLCYITVHDGEKVAGSYSLSSADALKVQAALKKAKLKVTSEGQPVIGPEV